MSVIAKISICNAEIVFESSNLIRFFMDIYFIQEINIAFIYNKLKRENKFWKNTDKKKLEKKNENQYWNSHIFILFIYVDAMNSDDKTYSSQ